MCLHEVRELSDRDSDRQESKGGGGRGRGWLGIGVTGQGLQSHLRLIRIDGEKGAWLCVPPLAYKGAPKKPCWSGTKPLIGLEPSCRAKAKSYRLGSEGQLIRGWQASGGKFMGGTDMARGLSRPHSVLPSKSKLTCALVST